MTATLVDRTMTPDEVIDVAAIVKPRRRRPILLVLTISWLTIVVLSALLANILPLPDPDVDVGQGLFTKPFTNWSVPLGTDGVGRDILSRLIYGARVSLAASIGAMVIALTLGLIVGILSGFFRGKVDAGFGLIVDSILAFPGLVLLLALAATLQPSVRTVIIGLAILGWPQFARLSRASTLRLNNAEFVTAARGSGAKRGTILVREILPTVFTSVLTLAGLVAASLILAEAALSFLGLGVRPPTPSWGNMIADARPQLRTRPWLMLEPAIVLFLTIFSLNILGDWLRSRSSAASKI